MRNLMLAGVLVVLAGGAATAGEPTKLSLDDALKTAKDAGKPLMAKIGTRWCGPCKQMTADLAKPEAQDALSGVVFIEWDAETDAGAPVAEKLAVSGYPTTVALRADGSEIARKEGYLGLPETLTWIKSLASLTAPIAAVVADADAHPHDGARQLEAAVRLSNAGRHGDALPYVRRAEKAGPKAVAATASWLEARIVYDGARHVMGKVAVSRVALAYASDPEGERALRYLATLPSPPVALLEKAIASRAKALGDDAGALNDLCYVAMRGGAHKAAKAIAERILVLRPTEPSFLDTAAEAANMRGDRDEAVRIEARVMALAGTEIDRFRPNMERFKAGGRKPGADIVEVMPPTLEIEAPKPVVPGPGIPRTVRWERAISDAIRAENGCWKDAGSLSELAGAVFPSDEPGKNRVVLRAGAPAGLAKCVDAAVKRIPMAAGAPFTFWTDTMPESFAARWDAALKIASTDCASAGATSAEGVATASAGGRMSVTIEGPAAACVQRVLAIEAPVTVMRRVSLKFSAPVVATAKPSPF